MDKVLFQKLERLKEELFVYVAGLRNFLAHDYQKSTVAELEKFLRAGIKDAGQFIEYIEKS